MNPSQAFQAGQRAPRRWRPVPRLVQLLRIGASAGLFTCLGLGGVLCTALVLPGIVLSTRRAELRRERARAFIQRSFRLFVLGLEASGILKVQAEDLPTRETLRGAILVANHPSYLDVVVLLALLPEAVCVVKNGVWRNPFFGPLVRMAGFLPTLDPAETLASAEAVLRRGAALIIFPEGTRTPKGRSPRFQRGAARLALRTGAPILPVLIHVDPPLLEKGDKWHNIPSRTCRFRVRGDAFFPSPRRSPEPTPESLLARRWTESLERYYEKNLHALQCFH